MIKYFCDKCNKELENYDIFTIDVTPPEIRQWEDDAYTGTCILCRSCLKELQKWLKVADRPSGKWIVNMSDYKSVCSVCGANETHFIYGTEMWYGLGKSKFCPYCGAQMKGA